MKYHGKKITVNRCKWALIRRFWNFCDEVNDKRICGISLTKYVPSVFRDDENGVGMTGSQSTRYCILKEIFSHVEINDNDSFLDVGCGKGRVLAYLIKEKYGCKKSGIEINKISSAVALEWSKRYKDVEIIEGDAFKLDYDPYTVLFLGRPFLPKTFAEFLDKLESSLSHPITFIYWVDQQSGYMLNDRKGWKCQYKSKIDKLHGLKVHGTPQGFSVWTYTPHEQ